MDRLKSVVEAPRGEAQIAFIMFTGMDCIYKDNELHYNQKCPLKGVKLVAPLLHREHRKVVCWVRMSLSITFAWPSFTVDLFKSENTTLHRPMTDTEAALFGSMFSLGSLVCTPVLGLLLDVLGRKRCMILSALVHVLAWAIIVFTRRVEVLLAAMFIAGTSCAAFLVIPIFITEICQPSVRGTMASCMILAYCFGTLGSYLLGGFMDYTPMCYACLSVAVLGLLMTTVLKESPVFLMKKGKDEEATKAAAFYLNATEDSKEVMQEIDAIRKTLNRVEEVASKEEKVTDVIEKPERNVSCWQFFKTSKSTRKATTLTLVLIFCCMFQGYVAVSVYAGTLFKEAVPSISPVLCSVMLAVVSIAASLLSAYLIDVAGRRPLMLYSCLGSGVCCVLLGSQIQMHWAPHVVTAVIIYLFCFIYTLGAGAVPFVLAAEVFLPEVSSVLSMAVYELAWLCSFVVLFAFGPLVSLLGLGMLFHVFAIICFLTTVYTAYYLPETKGLTVDAIQKLF